MIKQVHAAVLLILITVLHIYAGKVNRTLGVSKVAFFSHASFICPNLDDDDLIIVPSSCNGNDGQILGMRSTGTGVLKFTWKDANGKIVGTNADLIGVPAGTYTVELADDSKCKAATSPAYYIGVKDQVIFDDKNITISKPSCNNADGSITGISITNAVSYQWTDSNAKIVANTIILNNVIADTYTLTAVNMRGVTLKKSYTIPPATSVPKIIRTELIDAECNSTGGINVIFDIKASDPPYRYALQIDGSTNDIQTGYILYRPDSATEIRLFGLAPKFSL